MKRFILVYAAAGLMLAASSVQANLTNGSFEAGDITEWTTVLFLGGSTSVVSGHSKPGGSGTTSWTTTDGSYFTLQKTDEPDNLFVGVDYVYSIFGENSPINVGFEEWAIGKSKPLPIVPAPGAIVLGGIGVCLIGWLRRFDTL